MYPGVQCVPGWMCYTFLGLRNADEFNYCDQEKQNP